MIGLKCQSWVPFIKWYCCCCHGVEQLLMTHKLKLFRIQSGALKVVKEMELPAPQQQIWLFYAEFKLSGPSQGLQGTLYRWAFQHFQSCDFSFCYNGSCPSSLLCAGASLGRSHLEHCQSRHVWKPLPALLFLNSCMWVNAAVARCCLFTADKLSQWEHFISSMLEFIKYSLEQWFELTYPCSLLNSGLWSELLSGRSNGSLIVYENMNSFSKRDFHVQKSHNSMVSCSQLSTLTTRLLSIIQAATTASFFLLEHTGALWG